jgi:hypothetical protein
MRYWEDGRGGTAAAIVPEGSVKTHCSRATQRGQPCVPGDHAMNENEFGYRIRRY